MFDTVKSPKVPEIDCLIFKYLASVLKHFVHVEASIVFNFKKNEFIFSIKVKRKNCILKFLSIAHIAYAILNFAWRFQSLFVIAIKQCC